MSEVIHHDAVDEAIVTVYDDRSQNWSLDPEINVLFLRAIQNHMNDRLRSQGHVFLNELYDELGLPRTSQGQLVGWLLTNGNGIDWQIEPSEENNSFTLTFYVDGEIYDKIEERIG